MPRSTSRFAFKEWAAVCRAIASGRQTVLFRKGGIHERRGWFAVEHDEFWLFPTRFHQVESELTEDGREFLAVAQGDVAEPGSLALREFVAVTDVCIVEREEQLPRLRPFHIYADHVLGDRFRYRQPGLTLLIVRAFVRTAPLTIADSPHFAGCRSWVELPSEPAKSVLRPALDEASFARARQEVLAALDESVAT